MSDNQEIDAFIDHAMSDNQEIDAFQGSYSTQISFDLVTCKSSWNVWSDAYITIPIDVRSSTGTSYTAATVIAPKDGGICGIISGISIGDESSTWLNENSGQLPLINGLRMTMEHGTDWLSNEAADSLFTRTSSEYRADDCQAALASPGSAYGTSCQPYAGASSIAIDVGAFPSQSIRNPTYNRAFEDAASLFALQCPFNAATNSFRGIVRIPLSSIHSLFSELNFPLKNLHLKITFFFNNPSYQPFVCANGPAPLLTIGQNGSSQSCCIIHYPAITPSPALEAKLIARMKEGMKRKISFLLTDYFGQSLSNNTQSSISQVISQSICGAQQIWMFSPPTGAMTSSTAWSPLMSAATFQSVNVVLAGRNYLNFPMQTSNDFWQQIKDSLPMSGVSDAVSGLIDYRGFLANRKWVMVNVSRFQNDRNIDTPTTLQMVCQRSDLTSNSTGTGAGPVDYIFLVTRIWQLTIEMTGGCVKLASSGVLG